jgi:tetratricopeptide (TPR) repeat protein
MGRPAESLGSVRLASDIAASLSDGELVARAAEAKGKALLALGSWREARDALELATRAFDELGMRGHAARTEVAVGDTWFFVDDLERATTVYGRAREVAAGAGDHSVLGAATSRLAIVEMELGHADAALARYHAAIDLQRSVGDRAAEASASTYLAILEHDLGMLDVARARLETLVVVTRELGGKKTHGIASLYLGTVLLEVGELADATAALEIADRSLGETAAVSAQAYARGWRSVALARAGDVDGAGQMLELARGYFRARKEQSFYASALELLAGHLDLARAADASDDPLAAAAHHASAKRRLALAPSPERAQSDVRIARRLLEAALGVTPSPRAAGERLPAAAGGPVIVEQSGAWFRAPGGSLVDLSRRAPLRKLLSTLLVARLEEPGKPVPTTDLMRAVWTDTRELPVLQNRLRVAIATLRKLGLSSTLFTKGGGYVLDPRREVLAADASSP